ncbi:hypothetical protein RMATCC62417_12000 [Rhizopus microsporus]|nr:hypothetical protein RMATCC62417_12000 [Rhizopus microsporus]
MLDANYKTNLHKLVFTLSLKRSSLRTFEIAGAWISKEKELSFEWTLQCLKNVVWPEHFRGKIPLPSVIVTDNERALRSAILTVFPSTLNMLYYIHLQRNVEINLLKCVTEGSHDKRELIKLGIQSKFQEVALKANTQESLDEAVADMKQHFLKHGFCKKGKSRKTSSLKREFSDDKEEYEELKPDGLKSIERKLARNKVTKYIDMIMKEAKHWTQYHSYKYMHFNNRSTNRVESSHSAAKSSIKSSSGNLNIVTRKIDEWYTRSARDM